MGRNMKKDHSYVFLVIQNYNRGYDTFDSFVVICDDEEEARNTHPSRFSGEWNDDSWCPKRLIESEVKVTKLGITHKQELEVVCRSFNAG